MTKRMIAGGLAVIMMTLSAGCAPETSVPETESVTNTETETMTETETSTESESAVPETETETTADESDVLPEAGLNPALTRDGTPKKYFTMSFDDGITQDEKIIELLKKYNMTGATFFINTGLGGLDLSAAISENLGIPGVKSLRYTMDELKTGIYDGYDVECHGLTHAILTDFEKDAEALKREVGEDAANIAALMGYQPVGLAWPGGFNTETTARRIAANTTVRFARACGSTYDFSIPQSFMNWWPTCSVCDERAIELARQFAEAECTEDMLFYVWCHGYELDAYELYDEFEELLSIISSADGVISVTNAEFYQLFKDDVKLWKR